MVIDQTDPNRALTLDGNAAAGILNEIFALEITTSLIEYTGCSREGELGALLALSRLRGLYCVVQAAEIASYVLCKHPMVFYLDLRGAVYLHLNPISAERLS